jgi:hypothetical protein
MPGRRGPVTVAVAGLALLLPAAGHSRREGCIALSGAYGQRARADERRKEKCAARAQNPLKDERHLRTKDVHVQTATADKCRGHPKDVGG